jgi:hypothetical protein
VINTWGVTPTSFAEPDGRIDRIVCSWWPWVHRTNAGGRGQRSAVGGRRDALSAQLRSHHCAAARPAVGTVRACRIMLSQTFLEHAIKRASMCTPIFDLFFPFLLFFFFLFFFSFFLQRESNEL